VLRTRSRAIEPGEPGQSRKAAAVSRSLDVPRGSLVGASFLPFSSGAGVDSDACQNGVPFTHPSTNAGA